ncbi:hypothetical protein JTE90_022422 [Oedothorax gibbosus]|uniref:Uncharacterized protein n=1 Tax=Oedothorax gibbosus TaxID=931172 RepID=A0AAV6TLP4_9ARAC|nr:hypothetical protein JTE90_022422 [Oedothorax gibbosus]
MSLDEYPDATTPQNPIYAPFLHWAIQNIPGNQVSRGEVVSNYHPPSPPPYSDPHRYIILIYKQPGFITERSLKQAAKNNFNVKSFVQSQNLKEPVAGKYFKVSASDQITNTEKQIQYIDPYYIVTKTGKCN